MFIALQMLDYHMIRSIRFRYVLQLAKLLCAYQNGYDDFWIVGFIAQLAKPCPGKPGRWTRVGSIPTEAKHFLIWINLSMIKSVENHMEIWLKSQ